MVSGISSRRQMGGFVPRSVTFRLTVVVPALFLGTLVLAMILVSLSASDIGRDAPSPMFCAMVLVTASDLKGRRAEDLRPRSGGWIAGWERRVVGRSRTP